MKMMMKPFTLAAMVLVGTFGLSSAVVAQVSPVSSIDELIQRVGKDSREARAEAQRRVNEFKAKGTQQRAELRKAQAKLARLRGEERRNATAFDENEVVIGELTAALTKAQGSFRELFGEARKNSGELVSMLGSSYISGQYGGRTEALKVIADSKTLPEVSQLENIYQTILGEMVAQAEIVTFSGNLGEDQFVNITRVGSFLAWTTKDAKFISMEDGDMVILGRQPPGRIRSLAHNVSNGSPEIIVKGPVDPTRGTLLKLSVQAPSLWEQYQAGKEVGWVVTVMAFIGAFIGLWRLFALSRIRMAIRAQMRKSQPGNNPLGRIMAAYESAKDKDLETVELKLDDAIIKETGKLEFGISLIKVLAAVSPLMGLLGTVIGMIKTFQNITLYGAGDPKMMAGGISFALITTVLGLLSAIPLLLLHSFCSSAARAAQQVLEEQASGMIASNAEARNNRQA